MEREKVKNILKFCREIEGEIKLRKNVLQDYEDAYYTSGGAGALDGMPRGSRTSNPTQSAALNITDSAGAAMRDLRAEIEELSTLKAAVIKELGKLNYYQKNILYYFYIKNFQWVQIAVQINYSETQCKNIRNRGLEILAGYFSKNEFIKNFNYPF